jgi:hypothetical protein
MFSLAEAILAWLAARRGETEGDAGEERMGIETFRTEHETALDFPYLNRS